MALENTVAKFLKKCLLLQKEGTPLVRSVIVVKRETQSCATVHLAKKHQTFLFLELIVQYMHNRTVETDIDSLKT